VFGDAVANGKTARLYAQDMTGNCALVDQGAYYVVHHNGLAYSTTDRALCQTNDVPDTQLQADINNGTLPNVGWLQPSNRDDAHKPSTRAQWDAWLKVTVPKIMAGPDYQSGDLVIVISTDEGNGTLPLIPVYPTLAGAQVNTPLDQLAVYRMFERYAGVSTSGDDALSVFGL
jgi:acid phosphatase